MGWWTGTGVGRWYGCGTLVDWYIGGRVVLVFAVGVVIWVWQSAIGELGCWTGTALYVCMGVVDGALVNG